MFIDIHDLLKDKLHVHVGATGMDMEQDLDEEKSARGEFQGAETKAKMCDDSVGLTQSMPHIVDDSTDHDAVVDGLSSDNDRGIPSLSKSVEYKCVMEEVKGQREQLLVSHNCQREKLLEQEEGLEQAKGEGEEDGSTVEEMQPMEGMG